MGRSIRIRLIGGVIAIITIPLLCIFGIIAWNIVELSRDNYIAASSSEIERVSAAMKLFLDEAKANMSHLAASPELRGVDAGLSDFLQAQGMVKTLPRDDDALGRKLREACVLLQQFHPDYRKVYLGSRWGGFISNADAPRQGGYDPRTRAWYKAAAATTGLAVLSSPFRSTDGEPTISAARAFMDASGGVLGVVSADISLSVITDMVETVRPGKSGFVVVAEKNGVVIADTQRPEASLKPLAELGDAARQALFSGPAGVREVSLDGVLYVVNAYDAPWIGWRFISCIEKRELMEPARRTVTAIAWVSLGSLVLIIAVLSYFINRGVIRPLARVGDFLRAMGAGRYDMRLENRRRRDEIADIFTDLNTLAGRLSQTMESLHDKTREAQEKMHACQAAMDQAEQAGLQAREARRQGRLQAAGRLEGIVDAVEAASGALLAKAGQARRGCEVQAGRVEETAAAMGEMNATVLNVARSAAQAAATSAQAREMAGEGSILLGRVLDAMDKVRSDARLSRERMADLGRRTETVGHILNIISDIADQTNLLALNAAIEAARAGDAGRGFAVVADEVRKLAEKTMNATKEVGEATKGIKDDTNRNCQAVDQAAAAVELTASLTAESGDILRRIVSLSDSTADQVRAIAAASEEQSATSDAINRTIGEIKDISLDTADVMRDSTEALDVLRGQIDDLASVIVELKQADQV